MVRSGFSQVGRTRSGTDRLVKPQQGLSAVLSFRPVTVSRIYHSTGWEEAVVGDCHLT